MGLPARTRTLVRVVVSVLIAVVVLEVVTRGWLAVRGRAYSGWETEHAMQEMVAAMGASAETPERTDDRYAVHPYTGWDEKSSGRRIAEEGERFRSGAADLSFDVLMIGSSVAAGFRNSGEKFFLRRLEESGRFTGEQVPLLLPFGRSAFKQPQQQMLFSWLLVQGLEPDAVICIDGFNEMALALGNLQRKVPTAFPSWGQWGSVVSQLPLDAEGRRLIHGIECERQAGERLLARAQRHGLLNSAVAGSLCRARLAAIHVRWQDAADALLERLASVHGKRLGSMPLEEGEEETLVSSVERWKRSVRLIHDVCSARGIPFLHVLQPNANVPGSKRLTAEEQAEVDAPETWMLAAVAGYPLMRTACEELRAEGVHSVDATMMFEDVEERVWRDAGHLNRDGYERLGIYVADALLELLAE